MKAAILFICVLILCSCSPPAPEQLAKESCDCFKKSKSYNNADKQIDATNNCISIVSMNLERLRQIEKDEDLNDEQAKRFENRFNDTYNNCK